MVSNREKICMNETLCRILKSREDVSQYLYHFTKGSNASDILKNIIISNSIQDVSGRGYICFTETPITQLTEMFKIFASYHNPMYAPYGIAIRKDVLFNIGARNVSYVTKVELQAVPYSEKWKYEEYQSSKKDFSWLREWRIRKKQVTLNSRNCFLITKTKNELHQLLFDLENPIDIEIDGCVSDGQFWGNAIGLCERTFKGVSIEDIEEINAMSKNEVDVMLSHQKFTDIEKTGLGSFLS